ncbi:MAG: transposase [Actinomycetota bacterium]|nr:transposase [Actinomycetota bacterium]
MASISPAERLRRELESTLDGVGEEVDPVEAVGRVGARLILQQALEDEVTEYLGRARYERTAASTAHRNGYEPVTVKTTSGSMQLERPRLRNVSQLDFASRVVGKGVARTHALEALVVASFLRGLSVRDVEAALKEAFDEPVVSKSTVSRICQETAERYRAWCSRRLEQHDLVYLFLDAIYLKLRPDDEPAEGVLVAWGLTLEGQKVLLGLQLASRESYESWLDFGRDLKGRGMRAPALVQPRAYCRSRIPVAVLREPARNAGFAVQGGLVGRPCTTRRQSSQRNGRIPFAPSPASGSSPPWDSTSTTSPLRNCPRRPGPSPVSAPR